MLRLFFVTFPQLVMILQLHDGKPVLIKKKSTQTLSHAIFFFFFFFKFYTQNLIAARLLFH